MPHAYAGIGSRETPPEILQLMTNAASEFSRLGLVLRSGGAQGADTAFAQGADPKLSEIFLPWPGFNRLRSRFNSAPPQAYEMAKKYHPNWDALSRGGQALMARNCQQILGENLDDPVLFVLYWAPLKGGVPIGGTSQAVRIADDFKIPAFNMNAMRIENIEASIVKILEEKL